MVITLKKIFSEPDGCNLAGKKANFKIGQIWSKKRNMKQKLENSIEKTLLNGEPKFNNLDTKCAKAVFNNNNNV